MGFYSKCSKKLSGPGVCSCEHTGYTTAAGAPLANTSSFKDDCFYVVKKIFSSNPDSALQKAIYSKNNIWVVFGGFYVLLSSFAMMCIVEAIAIETIRAAIGPLAGIARIAIREFFPYGELFGIGFLLAVITFAVLSGCVKLLYCVFKQGFSFAAVMNLVSVSLFIYSAAMLAAIFFSVFFVQLSALLLVIGTIGSHIMLYIGIQKTAPVNKNLLWFFLGINTVTHIIAYFFAVQLLSALMNRVVENILMGGFDSFLNLIW